MWRGGLSEVGGEVQDLGLRMYMIIIKWAYSFEFVRIGQSMDVLANFLQSRRFPLAP